MHQTVEMGLLSSSILEMLLDHMVSKGLLTFLSMLTNNYCKKKSSIAKYIFSDSTLLDSLIPVLSLSCIFYWIILYAE
jgi:hypothetical protein